MDENKNIEPNTVSVKEWVIALIIMCIPIANIVFLFLWGFWMNDVKKSKRNWARATLIIMIAGTVISMIILGFAYFFRFIKYGY